MKKILIPLVSVIAFFVVPSVSFAGINSLNGLSTTAQTFATSTAPNSPHLLVQSSGTVHTFKWNGTPWLLNQGGTGTTTFIAGSIPFILNGIFTENNLNLFWDDVKHALGIGNANPQHTLDVSGAMYSRLVTISPSSSVTIDWNAGNVQTLTLTSNSTLIFSNGQAGGEYKLILNQDGTGGRTVTWPSSVKWENKTKPTITSDAGATDIGNFIFDGANYLGSLIKNFGVPSSTAKVLVVGGGGSGGNLSGGGGAGGYQYDATHPITAGSYTIVVGDGGVGQSVIQGGGLPGLASFFDYGGAGVIRGNGGGAGGRSLVGSFSDGGSGGGQPSVGCSNGSDAGIGSQGGNGGTFLCAAPSPSGGGGGAGGNGGNASGGHIIGGGGTGTNNSITGVSVCYAGGGSGGGQKNNGAVVGDLTAPVAGCGGGNGTIDDTTAGAGTNGQGGGGGGAGYDVSGGTGGHGGSGVVIIAFPTSEFTATGGDSTGTDGTLTWVRFTTVGTTTLTLTAI